MRAADHAGPRLHYAPTCPGGGPALALVNSLGTDFRLWDALRPHLPSGWRVLRRDFAGHGPSEPVDGRCTIAGHAEDLAALTDDVGIGRAAAFGGGLAWRMMLSRQSPDGFVATCEALRDADLTAQSARVAVPTPVIAGLEDGSTPPDLVRGSRG